MAFLCSLANSVSNLVSLVPDALISALKITLPEEPLQERSIDTMERHPVKVPLDCACITGRKDECLVSVLELQSRCREEFGWRVFRDIRPKIGVRTTSVGNRIGEPMEPSVMVRIQRGTVSGTCEPSLVAHEELVLDRLRVSSFQRSVRVLLSHDGGVKLRGECKRKKR